MTTNNATEANKSKIAIIGMAGRFPGADSIREFWQNIVNGIESIKNISDSELVAEGIEPVLLNNPAYVKKYGKVNGIDLFDAEFFGITPREAELTDPQQRLFLECAWETLEDAGYNPDTYAGSIGVFAGCGINYYLQHNILSNSDILNNVDEYLISIGNTNDYLTTRASYKLNLRGPSLCIGTACSTSLVTVHTACLSLSNGLCDMALAGGISLRIPQTGYIYKNGHILSDNGQCRAFDTTANGTVPGEGVGIVLLKRYDDVLRDHDNIYAIISSSAINNDGGKKAGFTAPSANGQASVIKMAHELANIKPCDISYIETHGTGTNLGDPIEFEGLKKAFNVVGNEEKYCALGAVKTNIGHLDSASGITGVIKTALALKHGIIPPTLHFTKPNPQLKIESSPFFIPVKAIPWNSEFPHRAGVSSFGIGGTNAHAVLEEAAAPDTIPSIKTWHIIPVSAKNRNSLTKSILNLSDFFRHEPKINIADVAFTLQQGRKSFPFRKAILCHSISGAIESLDLIKTDGILNDISPCKKTLKIVFMFSGQGAQYAGMTRDLYESEPVFKDSIDKCFKIVNPLLEIDLFTILYPSEDRKNQADSLLTETRFTQPALFIIEYALAQLFLDRGIKPAALIGHSLGEYVAACIAGVFSLEDALILIVNRAEIMQQQQQGAMLSISASEDWIRNNCDPQPQIAVINAPDLCVIGGKEDEIAEIEGLLDAKTVKYRRLHTSHAFHTSLMQGAVKPFEELCKQTPLSVPKIPFISNLSGTWITPENACDPSYWALHLRKTVQFSAGINQLAATYPDALFVEIGPGNILNTICRQNFSTGINLQTLQTLPGRMQQTEDSKMFLTAIANIWEYGGSVEWAKNYPDEIRCRVSLPTYPFDRKRYWVETIKKTDSTVKNQSGQNSTDDNRTETITTQSQPSDLSDKQESDMKDNSPLSISDIELYLKELWQKTLGIKNIGIHDNYIEIGGDSLFAVQIFNAINKKFNIRMPISILINNNTISTFAAYLLNNIDSSYIISNSQQGKLTNKQDYSEEKKWNTVIAIQPEGNLPPFFCIAGIGGNPMTFIPLSKLLGNNRPFFALQYRGVDGILKPHDTIEAMAEEFIADIKRVQPKGPYFIGGYSLGGLVAYEMAQQLIKMGEAIGCLVLLDTSNPSILKWTFKGRLYAHLSNICSKGPKYIKERIVQNFSYRLRKKKALTIDKNDFEHRFDTLAIQCYKALDGYKSTPIDVNVLLVKSGVKIPPSKAIGIGHPYHESNGWRSFVPTEKLNIKIVNAHHLNMLSEPFVSETAKHIANNLADFNSISL